LRFFGLLCPSCFVAFLARTRLVWAAKSALPCSAPVLEKSLTPIFEKGSSTFAGMELSELELLKTRWNKLTASLEEQFGDVPDLQVVLFLIGVQELGKGRQVFSKDEKQDLMHLATCRVLSQYGYYEYTGLDDEGWPQYELIKKLPPMTLREQDILLKKAVLSYFEKQDLT
jgi:hypothetical protein